MSAETSATPSSCRGSIDHLVAGAAGGVFSKGILQPLDLVKTRLQVLDSPSRINLTAARSIAQTVWEKEGLKGYYAGIGPNLVGEAVSWGLYFSAYDVFRTVLSRYRAADGIENKATLGPLENLACASAAGIFTTAITNPIWLVKTRMQLQGSSALYSNAFHCVGSILRTEGVAGLYRGLGPAMWLVSNGAFQFMFYEELKRISTNYDIQLGSQQFLSMGALSKFFSSTLTYPLQVVRSRMYQPRASQQSPRPYTSVLSSFASILKREGFAGMYSGFTVHCIKSVPASALTFFAFEHVLRILPHYSNTSST